MDFTINFDNLFIFIHLIMIYFKIFILNLHQKNQEFPFILYFIILAIAINYLMLIDLLFLLVIAHNFPKKEYLD